MFHAVKSSNVTQTQSQFSNVDEFWNLCICTPVKVDLRTCAAFAFKMPRYVQHKVWYAMLVCHRPNISSHWLRFPDVDIKPTTLLLLYVSKNVELRLNWEREWIMFDVYPKCQKHKFFSKLETWNCASIWGSQLFTLCCKVNRPWSSWIQLCKGDRKKPTKRHSQFSDFTLQKAIHWNEWLVKITMTRVSCWCFGEWESNFSLWG